MYRGSLAAYPLFQPKFLSVSSCHYQRKIAPKNMLTLQNNLICIPSDKSATSPTTHKLSTLSRKALIASKAIRINTFTVKSPLVDPLNNAVPCTEAVMGPLLPNQILVLLMAATYQKQILASGERGTFSKLKTRILRVCCQSKVYIEYLDFVQMSSVHPLRHEKALSLL